MKDIEKAKKILIKIGTSTITKNHKLNTCWIGKKAKEISDLIHSDINVLLISSGAVGAGMEIDNLLKRPKDVLKLQLLSGKGQPHLMYVYESKFKKFGIHTAQILLTHHNFSTRAEVKNLSDVIEFYFKTKTLPIINTNDIITKEELMNGSVIKFSDNDELAALVAKSLKMELLLILTDVEGLYWGYNDNIKKQKLIETVNVITDEILEISKRGVSPLGLGGMYSKVKVAKEVAKYNIPTIIANGKYSIQDIISNRVKRTIFTKL